MGLTDEHRDKLKKIEEDINNRTKNIADWKIQKDIEQMEQNGAYDDPEKWEQDEIINSQMKKYNVWDITYNDKGEAVNKKLILANLGELIFRELGYNFLTTTDNEEMYAYNGGYYEPNGEQIARATTERYLEEETKEHYKNEVVGYIRDKNYQPREIFNPPVHFINLKNGVYDLINDELKEHDPKYYFLNEIPVEYDAAATCPNALEFIKEVVYPEDIPVLQEFYGYCMYRKYHIHKACMFLGGGRNGKSTNLSLLKCLLGENNVSNQELYPLITNKFATANLYGKLANIAADISNKALERTGMFKSLTGNDTVYGEKKFKDGFGFNNYAKMIFSANTLPKSEDNTYAFFSRWILISFPNTFEGKNCNPYILDEITTPEELSGLFNWAIEGLKRLLANGTFSYGKTVEEVMEQYKTMSDPVYAYCTEFIKSENGNHIIKADFVEKYIKWSKKNKLPITPQNILTQEISKHFPEMRTGKAGPRGKQKPAYWNITWQNKKNPDTKLTGVEA